MMFCLCMRMYRGMCTHVVACCNLFVILMNCKVLLEEFWVRRVCEEYHEYLAPSMLKSNVFSLRFFFFFNVAKVVIIHRKMLKKIKIVPRKS